MISIQVLVESRFFEKRDRLIGLASDYGITNIRIVAPKMGYTPPESVLTLLVNQTEESYDQETAFFEQVKSLDLPFELSLIEEEALKDESDMYPGMKTINDEILKTAIPLVELNPTLSFEEQFSQRYLTDYFDNISAASPVELSTVFVHNFVKR